MRSPRTVLGVLVLSLLTPMVAAKEEVVSALSQYRIAITANFDGSEIFVYGAIKREQPPPDQRLGVVITIAGPHEPVTVRRKARRAGIWVNTDMVEIKAAPTFYAVASSAPLTQILNDDEDLKHEIRIEEMITSSDTPTDIAAAQTFSEALVRIRQRDGLYVETPGTVAIQSQTLFGTQVTLPANLVKGEYTATTYITRDGVVIDKQEKTIRVHKIGLERWIYNLAHEQPLTYGVLAVLIAAVTGWLASAIFRRI